MYDDAKMTYTVIALLVVILAGVAYYLRSNSVPEAPPVTTTAEATTTKQATGKTTTQNQSSATSTASGTMNTDTPSKAKTITGAIIHTTMGDIEFAFDLRAPNTIQNFVTLASTNFYNGVRFHRVIKDFMIQTGDPLSKDLAQKNMWGTGGPGYKFPDELKGDEKYTQGTVAMANSGPNTNGSQFFIVTASPQVGLPASYTIFGHVVKGLDTALKIQDVKTEYPGQLDRPVNDIIVTSVELK